MAAMKRSICSSAVAVAAGSTICATIVLSSELAQEVDKRRLDRLRRPQRGLPNNAPLVPAHDRICQVHVLDARLEAREVDLLHAELLLDRLQVVDAGADVAAGAEQTVQRRVERRQPDLDRAGAAAVVEGVADLDKRVHRRQERLVARYVRAHERALTNLLVDRAAVAPVGDRGRCLPRGAEGRGGGERAAEEEAAGEAGVAQLDRLLEELVDLHRRRLQLRDRK